MRITVREGGGKHIRLIFPTGLVLNRVTAAIGSVQLRKENISISAEQLHAIPCELDDRSFALSFNKLSP